MPRYDHTEIAKCRSLTEPGLKLILGVLQEFLSLSQIVSDMRCNLYSKAFLNPQVWIYTNAAQRALYSNSLFPEP